MNAQPATLDPQPTLPLFKAQKEDPNVDRFLALLRAYGHLTRKQIGAITGWTERDVRALAEAAGLEVVRGQKGFCLFDGAAADEILAMGEKDNPYERTLIEITVARTLRSIMEGAVPV